MLVWRILLLILCCAVYATASAQGETLLSYGDSTHGEITNRNYEVEYSVYAEAGDVVVITMTPEDDDEFRYPGILLLDDSYDVVAEAFDTYSVTLFHDVKQSANYYILATRNDGRSGKGEGEFLLTLDRARQLKSGQDICDSTTSEINRHYAIRVKGKFDVWYQFNDGDFRPEVTINAMKLRGNGLDSRMTLTGPSLERGSIGATVRGGEQVLLIVEISQRAWDWSDNKTANYGLRLETGEPADDVAMSILASSTINIRSGPGTQFDIVGSFQSGGQENAFARNEDGSWLKTDVGWVFANLVEPCGEVMRLPKAE